MHSSTMETTWSQVMAVWVILSLQLSALDLKTAADCGQASKFQTQPAERKLLMILFPLSETTQYSENERLRDDVGDGEV